MRKTRRACGREECEGARANEFEHASVWVDLEHPNARTNWH